MSKFSNIWNSSAHGDCYRTVARETLQPQKDSLRGLGEIEEKPANFGAVAVGIAASGSCVGSKARASSCLMLWCSELDTRWSINLINLNKKSGVKYWNKNLEDQRTRSSCQYFPISLIPTNKTTAILSLSQLITSCFFSLWSSRPLWLTNGSSSLWLQASFVCQNINKISHYMHTYTHTYTHYPYTYTHIKYIKSHTRKTQRRETYTSHTLPPPPK